MLLPTAMPLAFGAGVLAVSVGAGPVRNVQLTGAKAFPAVSLIPLLSRTVYLVSAARFAVGLMVSTRVVVLNVTPAGTTAPVASVPTWIFAVVVLNPVIASLKVAVAFTVTA